MRLYGGKQLRNNFDRRIQFFVETRDAYVYDVLPDQRIARVYIQGSNKLILAHYPQNWESAPVWLKAGNAVTIRHTNGIRGRIELIGHSSALPSLVNGATPVEISLPDVILSGLQITPVL